MELTSWMSLLLTNSDASDAVCTHATDNSLMNMCAHYP